MNQIIIATFIHLFLLSSTYASEDCNSLLSDGVTSSIHDLAKLRISLDSKIAAGDSSVMVRSLERSFARKKTELISIENLDERLKREVARLQAQPKSLDSAIALQQKRLDDVQTKISVVNQLKVARAFSSSAMLSDGSILSFGGQTLPNGKGLLDSIERYDSHNNEVSEFGRMIRARSGAHVIPLSDGRLRIIGGWLGSSRTRFSEVFDPATQELNEEGFEWDFAQKTIIPYAPGKAMLYGDTNEPIQLYDADQNLMESFENADTQFAQAFSVLPSGKVVRAGGRNRNEHIFDGVVLIDPFLKTQSAAGKMLEARSGHALVALNEDSVLLIGGSIGIEQTTSSIERFDFSTGLSRKVGDLIELRSDLQTALLEDGRVVMIGEVGIAGQKRSLVEIFDPEYGETVVAGYLSQYRTGAQLFVSGLNVFVVGGRDEAQNGIVSIEKIKVGER